MSSTLSTKPFIIVAALDPSIVANTFAKLLKVARLVSTSFVIKFKRAACLNTALSTYSCVVKYLFVDELNKA